MITFSYAKWLRGPTEADIEKIRRAFGFATDLPLAERARKAISLMQIGKDGKIMAVDAVSSEPVSAVNSQ